MEWFLIEYYKKAIKKYNEEHKGDKDKTVKYEISTYSAPWKQIMWGLLILSMFSLLGLVCFAVKLIMKAQMKIFEFYVYVFLLPVAVLSMIAFIFLQSLLSKRFAKENIEMHKIRLDILKDVIIVVYKEEALEKKVRLLIDIYKDKLQKIEKDESKMTKAVWTIFTVVGAIAATSIANLKEIGIKFEEWLSLMLCILALATIVAVTLYLATMINPNRDKYNLMIDRLNHLCIILEKDAQTGEAVLVALPEEKDGIQQEKKANKKRKKK